MPVTRSRKIILIVIPILLAVVVIKSFFFRKSQINPVTGTEQYIALTPEQEIRLGIEISPQLAKQFGGMDQNLVEQKRIKRIGRKLISSSVIANSPYQFDFHVLADSQSVNAFAFPGGQIFITKGLLQKLKTEEEIAAVISHQIGHVVGRHASEKLFKSSILQGIISPDTVMVSDFSAGLTSKYLSDFITLDYSEEEENEADILGYNYAVNGRYQSNLLLQDIDIKGRTDTAAKSFFQKHSNFQNRKEKLETVLKKGKL